MAIFWKELSFWRFLKDLSGKSNWDWIIIETSEKVCQFENEECNINLNGEDNIIMNNKERGFVWWAAFEADDLSFWYEIDSNFMAFYNKIIDWQKLFVCFMYCVKQAVYWKDCYQITKGWNCGKARGNFGGSWK